jgi:hypothetical protein
MCGGTRPANKPAPQEKRVAQGSLSSLAAFRPRRAFDGAAKGNSDYLVCGPRGAGPLEGPQGRTAGPALRPPRHRHKGRVVASFTQIKGARMRHPGAATPGPNRWVVEPGHRINLRPEPRPAASFSLAPFLGMGPLHYSADPTLCVSLRNSRMRVRSKRSLRFQPVLKRRP